MRHLVAMQFPGTTADATGYVVPTWTTAANVYARIEPLTVRERLLAGERQSEMSHRIIIRYSPELSALDGTWRVLYGSRVFLLDGAPINRDERNRSVEMMCIERAA